MTAKRKKGALKTCLRSAKKVSQGVWPAGKGEKKAPGTLKLRMGKGEGTAKGGTYRRPPWGGNRLKIPKRSASGGASMSQEGEGKRVRTTSLRVAGKRGGKREGVPISGRKGKKGRGGKTFFGKDIGRMKNGKRGEKLAGHYLASSKKKERGPRKENILGDLHSFPRGRMLKGLKNGEVIFF